MRCVEVDTRKTITEPSVLVFVNYPSALVSIQYYSQACDSSLTICLQAATPSDMTRDTNKYRLAKYALPSAFLKVIKSSKSTVFIFLLIN